MSQMTISLSQPRDALFPSPSAEMLSSQVSIPCQVVEPAHPYACCYTWNDVHLLVVLHGCSRRQADRMSLAPRPVRRHSICWPGERGHRDPWGRLVHCCDWTSRQSQSHIHTDLFWQVTNFLSNGNVFAEEVYVLCLFWRRACWKASYFFPNYILLEGREHVWMLSL